jgi:hypothetical protein
MTIQNENCCMRKDQAAAEEPLEAITPEGNEDLTERLKLL